jgi:hypothetical protein
MEVEAAKPGSINKADRRRCSSLMSSIEICPAKRATAQSSTKTVQDRQTYLPVLMQDDYMDRRPEQTLTVPLERHFANQSSLACHILTPQ